jgi:hypothetical protein
MERNKEKWLDYTRSGRERYYKLKEKVSLESFIDKLLLVFRPPQVNSTEFD